MLHDHSKKFNDLSKSISELESKIPEIMNGFKALQKASIAEGALSSQSKELIALGIAIASGCEGFIGTHVHAALISGATSEEITETIGVAILMGGALALVQACEAMEALEQFIVIEKNDTAAP